MWRRVDGASGHGLVNQSVNARNAPTSGHGLHSQVVLATTLTK